MAEGRSADIDQGSPASGSVVIPVALLKFFRALGVMQLRIYLDHGPRNLYEEREAILGGGIAVVVSEEERRSMAAVQPLRYHTRPSTAPVRPPSYRARPSMSIVHPLRYRERPSIAPVRPPPPKERRSMAPMAPVCLPKQEERQ